MRLCIFVVRNIIKLNIWNFQCRYISLYWMLCDIHILSMCGGLEDYVYVCVWLTCGTGVLGGGSGEGSGVLAKRWLLVR